MEIFAQHFVAFFIGYVIGSIIIRILIHIKCKRDRIDGIIFVDTAKNLCKFNVISKDLQNPKKKEAIFLIKHTPIISREEQSL